MFGSKTDASGKQLTADGKAPILVGERVMDNTLKSVTLSEDKSRIIFEFTQKNGATFKASFWAPKEGEYFETNLDTLKRNMLHISTKIVTEQEFWDAVANTSSFEEYANVLITRIFSRGLGKKFNLKITYKRTDDGDIPTFPRYPNFIEKEGTEPSTFSTNPDYDFYTRSNTAAQAGPSAVETSAGASAEEPLF